MSAKKRNRACVLTPEGLQKLQSRIREQELADNAGYRYSLEKLGELTGLDPGTVSKILAQGGSDRRTLNRCLQAFGLTLENDNYVLATQLQVPRFDPNFVGREGAILDLNALAKRGAKIIAIQARGGVGKTTLARRYLQQEFDLVLEFPIAKETKDIASIESLLEEKLHQLGEEPGREFLVSLDRLKRKLKAEQIGILIDNLEPALGSAGKFIEPHRRYVELLRVLADPTVQSMTLITSREHLRESSVTVQHYLLKSLDIAAWKQFFQSRGLIPITLDAKGPIGKALAALHNAYGGNAKAMEIISSAIAEDFAGNVEAYWQANQDDLLVERELEDLITQQFHRLKQLDPEAYRLLCRMGCYRYQDVPTLPMEGLVCLFWDVPKKRHRRVIKSLQDRSLIEFEHNQYWLHPTIRAEAIHHLRESQYWDTSNRKAAAFWNLTTPKYESIEDTLKALEGYYHYLEIKDFDLASEIILQREKMDLAYICYRNGLLRNIISKIEFVLTNIESKQKIARFYNILGQFYLRLGFPRKSIEKLENSLSYSKEPTLAENEIISRLSIGYCLLELGEYQQALEMIQEIGERYEGTQFHMQALGAWFRLAFLNSILGIRDKAMFFAEKAFKDSFLEQKRIGDRIVPRQGSIVSYEYCIVLLGSTYKNLGLFEKALDMYYQAIEFSVESSYELIRAKALVGIAEILRVQSILDKALEKNLEAIRIFTSLDIKSDLAEAYYQLGLTYKTIGNAEMGKENFQKSLALFTEMEAPRQIEKVQRATELLTCS